MTIRPIDLKFFLLLFVFLFASKAHNTFGASHETAIEVEQLKPFYKYTQTITALSDLDDKNYVMDPFIMPVTPDEMLIGYKRGYAPEPIGFRLMSESVCWKYDFRSKLHTYNG